MPKTLLFLIALAFFLPGCLAGPSTSFVATRGVRAPLAQTASVQLWLHSPSNETVAEIGLVQVSGGEFAERVRAAKKVAKNKGGNGIVLLGTARGIATQTSTQTVSTEVEVDGKTTTTSTNVPVSETSSYEIDRYLVIFTAAK